MTNLDHIDPDIYENGTAVAIIIAPGKADIETFVQRVAKESGQRVDWHYMGGRGVVRAIGDLALVRETIELLMMSVRVIYPGDLD